MSHSCDSGHGHVHEHGHVCGHEHSEANVHALLDNALTLSGSWSYTCRSPALAKALETRVEKGLHQIAARLAENGVILGHIKALLQCGENRVAFSITRPDTIDRTMAGTWPPPGAGETWSLTVNVLSLVHTEDVTPALLEELFAE